MEPLQKATSQPDPKEKDIDLGMVLYKTGDLIGRFFNWISRQLFRLGRALLLCLFFLRRNILWLLLGTVIGLGYGLFLLSRNGTKYYSEMTVRTNFSSGRSLYGSMDFFNALVNSGRTDELSRILKISPAEASSLTYFEATPVENELIVADLYKNLFLKYDRNNKVRMDTFWIKTIKYKDFKTSLTKFDYPLHEIMVISTNDVLFPKIQQGIIDQISRNDLLQQIKTNGIEVNKEEQTLLTSSIHGIDTLRDAYNKRLLLGKGQNEGSGANNLTMLSGAAEVHTPELDVYDKMLQLKDELRRIKDQSVIENDIIQVYSPFSAVGQQVSIFKQNMVKYAIMGFCLTLIILISISFYKYLSILEQAARKKQPS